jgi:hypothetical protein
MSSVDGTLRKNIVQTGEPVNALCNVNVMQTQMVNINRTISSGLNWMPCISRTVSVAVAVVLISVSSTCWGQGRLLPFQGMLTDSHGQILEDGVRLVHFKIYDAPISGEVLWNGEIHKLTINRGLVNTILGSKSSLETVDFNRNLYLEMTVDGNQDGLITPLDPPLLPRQVMIPSVFAVEAANARTLEGHNWDSILTSSNPQSGKLRIGIIADNSIPVSKIASDGGDIANGLRSDQISEGAIGTSEIKDGSIRDNDLSDELLEYIRLRLTPAGTVTAFAGPADRVPNGWALCNGRALDVDAEEGKYRELFNAIGTAWGNGSQGKDAVEGVTDFNLPDLRGLFLRGVSHDSGADPDRMSRTAEFEGANAGNMVGSRQLDELKSHTHFVGRRGADGDGQRRARPLSWSDWDKFNDVLDTGATGGSETRPVNAYVNYIIKL